MSHCKLYLFVAFAFSVFRCLMYFIQHERVSKVKITPAAWKIKEVRDVALVYTAQIRLFMGFRAMVFGWGLTIKEAHIICQLGYLSLFFDVYIWTRLYRMKNHGRNNVSAVQYQNNVALYLQTLLVFSGVLLFF